MLKKKPPYGISNYEKIVTDNFYYIDKTKYVELLESLPEDYIFFLRPRKFGKSLFVSMLSYYYGIEHKDRFDKLFGNQYIGSRPTQKANSYYVINFDFSAVSSQESNVLFNSFNNKILDAIRGFNNSYKCFESKEMEYFESIEDAPALMTTFLRFFEGKQLNGKIYVIIDEYEHFTNELISFKLTEFRHIVSGTGYVRKFYEAIKIGVGQGIVDRFFATGVTPVTLDSLTSGFNIAKDKTLDFALNEMHGFTNEEVKNMLEYYEIKNAEIVLKDLESLYNGSLFNRRASQRVYNSNMVLYFLTEYLNSGEYPEKLIDNNIASDYGKIRSIFYLNNSPLHREKLNEITKKGETTALITEKFSFERDFTVDDFVSLLFYNGMLTIKEGQLSLLNFKIPNYVIKEIYWNFFKDEILIPEGKNINTDKLQSALNSLAQNNNIERWIECIEEVMTLLSNRDLQNFDEKYVKMLFITLAALSQLYIIKSEPEIEGKYPDLMYLYRKPYKPNYQFLFELKYLKTSESNKLNKAIDEAEVQVKNYLSKLETGNLENLIAYAIVFVGKKGHFRQVL